MAIIHISADEDVIRARIKKRGEETGRFIPENELVNSLLSPDISIRKLAPLCDLVVRFRNNGDTPRLLSVEDHSGNLQRGLYRHFGVITRQIMPFPGGLGPLFFENTAMTGRPFTKIGEASPYQPYYPEFEGCLLVKQSTSDSWQPCVAKLFNRVITCYAGSCDISSESEKPLFRYEVTDKTVVKLHDEYHFSASGKSPLFSGKRDSSGRMIVKEITPVEEKLRFSFYVNQIDESNNLIFLEFATPVDIARLSWKQHIELTKHEYKREKELGSFGDDPNRITQWKINYQSMDHSHNVNTLLALKGAIKLQSTALCPRRGKKARYNIIYSNLRP